MSTFIKSVGRPRALAYHIDTGSPEFFNLGAEGYTRFIPAVTQAFSVFANTRLFIFDRVGLKSQADILIRFERIDGTVKDISRDDRLMGTVVTPSEVDPRYTKIASTRVDSGQAWRFARTGRFAALRDALSPLDDRPYFKSSLIHEIGHQLGLKHLPVTDTNTHSVMGKFFAGPRFEGDTLPLHDISNLKKLYP